MRKKWGKGARPTSVGPPMTAKDRAELHEIWARKWAPAKRDHDEYSSKAIRCRTGGTGGKGGR